MAVCVVAAAGHDGSAATPNAVSGESWCFTPRAARADISAILWWDWSYLGASLSIPVLCKAPDMPMQNREIRWMCHIISTPNTTTEAWIHSLFLLYRQACKKVYAISWAAPLTKPKSAAYCHSKILYNVHRYYKNIYLIYIHSSVYIMELKFILFSRPIMTHGQSYVLNSSAGIMVLYLRSLNTLWTN